MLKNSFIHVPGVGQLTERNIWDAGILTWDDFLKDPSGTGFSPRKSAGITNCLKNSSLHLENSNVAFFYDALPKCEAWRLYPEFKDGSVFLDIETSGLYPWHDYITVIGLFDGYDYKAYIEGRNMDMFARDIREYSLVITFNGSLFDLPFISRHFEGVNFQAHIDLRFFLKRLGYSGGLKSIEKQMGISRDTDIEGMDGFEAVMLWERYRQGSREALDLLLQYNKADIVNLKELMERGYSTMRNNLLGNHDILRHP